MDMGQLVTEGAMTFVATLLGVLLGFLADLRLMRWHAAEESKKEQAHVQRRASELLHIIRTDAQHAQYRVSWILENPSFAPLRFFTHIRLWQAVRLEAISVLPMSVWMPADKFYDRIDKTNTWENVPMKDGKIVEEWQERLEELKEIASLAEKVAEMWPKGTLIGRPRHLGGGAGSFP